MHKPFMLYLKLPAKQIDKTRNLKKIRTDEKNSKVNKIYRRKGKVYGADGLLAERRLHSIKMASSVMYEKRVI